MKGKEYVRPIPAASYFFKRPTWSWFMVREFTAVFVGVYAVFLLVLIYRASDEQSFSAFFAGLQSPLSLVLHLVGLIMVLYHTVTWFKTTPQAMPLWQGEERVSPSVITGANYVIWIVLSAVIAWRALG